MSNLSISNKQHALIGIATNGLCIAASITNPVIILKSAALGGLCSLAQSKLMENTKLTRFLGNTLEVPNSYLKLAKTAATLIISGYIFFNIGAISAGINLGIPIANIGSINIPMGLNYLFSNCYMHSIGWLITPILKHLDVKVPSTLQATHQGAGHRLGS